MTSDTPEKNYVGLLQEKCKKAKVDPPIFKVENSTNNYFTYVCEVKDWSTNGTGISKKIAKQIAARTMFEKIETNSDFEIKSSEEHENRLKKIKESSKSPICKINELCQAQKMYPHFSDQPVEHRSKAEIFIVKCKVGELEVNSAQNSSKKLAKLDAATKMLELLTETPASSPHALKTKNHDMDLDDDKSVKHFNVE